MVSQPGRTPVQVPWPTPTRKRLRSPRRIRSAGSSSAAALCAAFSGVQTERLWPSAPSPSVLSKHSRGPVALIRKSYGTCVDGRPPTARPVTYGVGSPLSPSGWISGREREGDLRRLHQPDTNPDVGRHPVVIRPRRDERDGVTAAEPLARERSCGVAGNPCAEHDDPRHATTPFIAGSCATAGAAPSVDPPTPCGAGRASA